MSRGAALAAAACCLLAPASAGASGGIRPPAALSVSPSRLDLAGAARQTIRLANPGATRVVVDVARAGFALDPHGRPLVTAGAGFRSAATWLTAWPRRLSIAPGGSATLTVTSRLPRRAEPGDHGALVLLTTRPARAARVAVQMRVGVVVTVRAPGKVVHRLLLRSLRVRRNGRSRLIELAIANRGNVSESLGRVGVRLLRGRRTVATLRSGPRDLLPRTSGVVDLPYRGRARGKLRAVVSIPSRGRLRTFSVRL
jgi:hypothetical protein